VGFLEESGVPGATMAIARDDHLLLARGYGYADPDAQVETLPHHRFRIASISKPITATAILRLVEDGRLSLEDRLGSLLPECDRAELGAGVDAITVRDLLQHSSGWGLDGAPDPAFSSEYVASQLGVPSPPTADQLICYLLAQDLPVPAGSAYAYSNAGYIALARLIEAVTGEGYGRFVADEVFGPAGVSDAVLGRTRTPVRDEVAYHGDGRTRSVFPPHDSVSAPYGGFYLESMDGSSGWVTTVVSLLEFLDALDPLDGSPGLLRPATLDLMLGRPSLPIWQGSDSWVAMGWEVQPNGDDRTYWQYGALPGSTALLMRGYNGLTWAVLLNGSANHSLLREVLWRISYMIDTWPNGR
jgi:CubicO group peptidase (beta-lactamase class C family)